MLFKYLQRVLNIWRRQIDFDLQIVAGFAREKGGLDIVEMADLIHARFNRLKRVHAYGNMTGYCHAKSMCFGADHFECFQLYMVSNLELLVSCILVTLDRCARLVSSFYLY